MIFFETKITNSSVDFFRENLLKTDSVEEANKRLKKICGVIQFFNASEEFIEFKNKIEEHALKVEEPNRRAYGDFQTNENLAKNITAHLAEDGLSPKFVLEPTCGKGSFIFAVLKQFKQIKKIVGIEIYYPYIWETKFGILTIHLQNEALCKPDINIVHTDIFGFQFDKLAKENKSLRTLIIGNPPWVTNSELGALNSKNLPRKSNFKNNKGIDAITGKGNFDIGEYISLMILKSFDKQNGEFAFLIKSSVVKNILLGQKKEKHHIGHIRKLNIDAKKEFNVSVDACIFQTKLNKEPEYTCQESNFYSGQKLTEFGWHHNKFVYSINDYNKSERIDGECQFVWRQGIKHDCSKIMELDRYNGHFINGYKKEVILEESLLYGLLKSSDLKNETINSYRKTTIVTQKKIGQDTSYIKDYYPKTFEYLFENKEYFDRRKSTIYKGKPPYSIFGVGDYSFAKYKVAISGMYKRTTFSLILPENEKPLMLDDTCYFIGFDNLIDARIAQHILNNKIVQGFLKAIIFPDAKRSITKDILMRIDLKKVYDLLDINKLSKDLKETKISDWESFKKKLATKTEHSNQISLF